MDRNEDAEIVSRVIEFEPKRTHWVIGAAIWASLVIYALLEYGVIGP